LFPLFNLFSKVRKLFQTNFKDSDIVIAADCVAFSMGNFHKDYLKGKSLGIACSLLFFLIPLMAAQGYLFLLSGRPCQRRRAYIHGYSCKLHFPC
jgi:hypothetical protein